MSRNRDCTTCIAYCNMLDGDLCGLGFSVHEYAETHLGQWQIKVCPVDNLCTCVPKPKTKEEFIQSAKERGINWDPNEVIDTNDIF